MKFEYTPCSLTKATASPNCSEQIRVPQQFPVASKPLPGEEKGERQATLILRLNANWGCVGFHSGPVPSAATLPPRTPPCPPLLSADLDSDVHAPESLSQVSQHVFSSFCKYISSQHAPNRTATGHFFVRLPCWIRSQSKVGACPSSVFPEYMVCISVQ